MNITPATDLSPLPALLTKWGRSLDDYDAVIFGDGSGTTTGKPCGWGATVVVNGGEGDGTRKVIRGAMNTGTCGLAEVMPYLQALSWYDGWRKQRKDTGMVRVLIVTDNETVANQGNALAGGSKSIAGIKAHAPFWAALAQFDRDGYRLAYLHRHRSSSALNSFADALAGEARAMIAGAERPLDPSGNRIKAKHCNPRKQLANNPIFKIPKSAPKRKLKRA